MENTSNAPTVPTLQEIRRLRRRVGGWAISSHTWRDIAQYLSPGMRTLECGSGLSTLLFTRAQTDHTALEHHADYGKQWGPSVVACRLSGDPPWYDWEPPSDLAERPYGLILIDGPPGKTVGRDGFRRVAHRLISPGTVVVVDDTNRRADAELADWIIREFGRSWYEVRGRRKWWRVIEGMKE